MADIVQSSSMPSNNDKPVVVRVKRKAFQSRLEALWLEIMERSLKRPLLDFEKLSISDSLGKEELKIKKVFVQHVETVSSSEATIDILQSLVAVLSKSSHFEQVWRSRKGTVHEEDLLEMCHFYDVVRVDIEETTYKVQHQEIISSYSPILREFIPSAAEEIDYDIHAYMSKQASADDYVYDLYAVKDDINTDDLDASNLYPLIQVDDDNGVCDGPVESEFETNYSNDNPLHDYLYEETSEDEEEASVQFDDDDGFYDGPVESEFEIDDSNDEEISVDEEEVEGRASSEELEELDSSVSIIYKTRNNSPEVEYDWSESPDSSICGYEFCNFCSSDDDGGDDDVYDFDGDYDGDDWGYCSY